MAKPTAHCSIRPEPVEGPFMVRQTHHEWHLSTVGGFHFISPTPPPFEPKRYSWANVEIHPGFLHNLGSV